MTAGSARRNGQIGVILAGGGSGGHIFPNIAILEAMRLRDRNLSSLFLVSEKAVDASILRDAGERFVAIAARPLELRPRAIAGLLRNWGGCVRSARGAIGEMRDSCAHTVVIATGGYVSAPVANAAHAERTPLLLVNLDARPGKANRWAARVATERITACDGSAPASWVRVRPIVRREAVANRPPAACRSALGLDPDAPTLLVTGASQGARSINRFMEAFARDYAGALAGWQVIHQTGEEMNAALHDAYTSAGMRALIAPFINTMAYAWGSATLAVSRAGAGSVGEAWANGVPALFLPFPYHRDQHQRFNARPLADAGGAVIVIDRIDPTRNLADAGQDLLGLLSDPHRLEHMRRALCALGPPDGAEHVARAALRLCEA